MKKTSILLFLFLVVLGINQASAQTEKKLTDVIWVLQNPEKAICWEAIRFDEKGTFAYRRVKINSKNPSAEYNGTWKMVGDNQVILTIDDYQMPISIKLGEKLVVTTTNQVFNFAEAGSSGDVYEKIATVAIKQYGNSASMKYGVPAPKIKGATYFIP